MAITRIRQGFIIRSFSVLAVLLGILFYARDEARAHCDTMDGPVVKAAQKALATKNVNLVLIWVQKKDETEIKQRFLQTLEVRRLSRQASQLADNYFFETVVRLHRAGEGEPYTGLKPAGTDLGPVIPVADKAFQDGSPDALLKLFAVSARAEIQVRFNEALTKKSFSTNDIEAGREYVKAYITFMHHIEHLYEHEHRTALPQKNESHLDRVSTGSGSDLVQPSESKILREYCMPITDQVATAPCTDPIQQ